MEDDKCYDKGKRNAGEASASLKGVVRVGLTEKGTFEQRIKGRDGLACHYLEAEHSRQNPKGISVSVVKRNMTP